MARLGGPDPLHNPRTAPHHQDCARRAFGRPPQAPAGGASRAHPHRQIHDELDQAVLEAYGWEDLSAKGTHCSVGLRPSLANEEAPSLVPNGLDGHRPPLQDSSVATSNLSVSDSQHLSVYRDALLTRLATLNHERAAEEKTSDSPPPSPATSANAPNPTSNRFPNPRNAQRAWEAVDQSGYSRGSRTIHQSSCFKTPT